MQRDWIAALSCFLATTPLEAADMSDIARAQTFTDDALGLTVVGGELTLPEGRWEVASVLPEGALEQVYLSPDKRPEDARLGRRAHEAALERQASFSERALLRLFHYCSEYAYGHGGRGPASVAELDKARPGSVAALFERSPYPYAVGQELKGPFYFLLPDVPLLLNGNGAVPGQGEPLALELRPLLDDGRHFVLLNNGRAERRPIDRDLLARLGVAVTPVYPKAEAPASLPPGFPYSVLALKRDAKAVEATVTLIQRSTDERLRFHWRFSGAPSGGPQLLWAWAQARALEWRVLLSRSESPVLRVWTALSDRLYGGGASSTAPGAAATARGPERTSDIFSLLGGRAALQETLQTQLLRPGTTGPQEATIPLSGIKGVEVKSHPFEELLAGKAGGRLPLADVVPNDRLFVYFAKPGAFFPFLDDGADFLFRTGSLFTKNSVDDDIKGRTLRRLGLEEGFGRKFLASGEVLELALLAPDLFFIDGTDVTLLLRLAHPGRVAEGMKAAGALGLKEDEILERPLGLGRSACWLLHRDLVLISTSRSELERVFALARNGGEGSLGRSAEFRFMLSKLPLKKETRAYAYLSDPFIRRMVGPEVKIGQFRRIQARADMERITAGALLSLFDSRGEKPDLARLARLGYVPADLPGRYSLRDDLAAVSPVWGSPADMTPLGAVPFEMVTAPEAQAYRAYVDEYARYWRQYFDPVAMRLDDASDGALELSAFILPLLDSQIYTQLRTVLADGASGAALRTLAVKPEPALLLSMNLSEKTWTKVADQWKEGLSRASGISPRLFDLLGPGFHFAVQDADPIVVLGNADILGGLGGQALTQGVMRQGLPLLLSVLTRPCKIVIELQDEKAVLGLLRTASAGARPSGRPNEMQAEFRQVGDRNAWIYTMSAAGIVTIRFGIEVKNGFLIVSNIPWSQPVDVTAAGMSGHNGARAQLTNAAVRLGLPGLYATQQEQNQTASLTGMASLLPLLQTVSSTPEDATKRHAALFGFTPLHPGLGKWVWKDGKLESTHYGDAFRWKQPEYRAALGDFGLFEGIEKLSVDMQFEDGGLRSACRWVWNGKRGTRPRP